MATPIPHNQARFTVEEILRATGGTLLGPSISGEAVGVVTDSRAVSAGNIFVALIGERFDGHRYLAEVAHAGARLALVRVGTDLPPRMSAIAVADTTRALGELARFHRERWGKPVVAITGSAGKTTTKELTAAALGERTLKTAGNLNNAIGVPMTLLQLAAEHEVAVVEMGTNGPGEIAWLASIARPDIAVVTEVAAAHTEGLGTIADVAREKTDLLRALGENGVAIWNADNEDLALAVGNLASKQIRFGTHDTTEMQLVSHTVAPTLREACVFASKSTGTRCEANLRLFGVGAALDAAAALAVVSALRGDGALEAAALALSNVQPTRGRMCPVRANNDVLVLDDTYNANPISVERSLQTAKELATARGGRAIAVIGDMKELGAESVLQHRRIGRRAVELEFAAFVGCGSEMASACDASMTEAARHRLPSTTRVMHVIDPLQAISIVRAQVQPNDVVLIKGSRSMAMERLVDALAPSAEPA